MTKFSLPASSASELRSSVLRSSEVRSSEFESPLSAERICYTVRPAERDWVRPANPAALISALWENARQ
jgi:hypothetical protein